MFPVTPWLRAHTVGAAIFLPATLLLILAAERAQATGRRPLVPWLALGTWIVAGSLHYFHFGIGRFFPYNRRMWGAQVLTLAVVTLLPLGLGLLPVVLGKPRPASLRLGVALTATVLGLLAVVPVSGFLGDLLIPWIHANDL